MKRSHRKIPHQPAIGTPRMIRNAMKTDKKSSAIHTM
jgi:hypothetical protein